MIKSDVFSEEYRICILKCIHKNRSHSKIKELGYTIDEMVNEIVSRTWVSFINKDNLNYSLGTIAENQLHWTIIRLYQKPIPVIQKDSHYIDVKRIDTIEQVNALLKHECLSMYERKALEARFIKGKTLEAVGLELSLSKERVRQIQDRGLKKLRDLSEST